MSVGAGRTGQCCSVASPARGARQIAAVGEARSSLARDLHRRRPAKAAACDPKQNGLTGQADDNRRNGNARDDIGIHVREPPPRLKRAALNRVQAARFRSSCRCTSLPQYRPHIRATCINLWREVLIPIASESRAAAYCNKWT